MAEAQRLGISIVAIVDTNCDPDRHRLSDPRQRRRDPGRAPDHLAHRRRDLEGRGTLAKDEGEAATVGGRGRDAEMAVGRGGGLIRWRPTPRLVKELRERTGAGVMDCKAALAGQRRRPAGRGRVPAQEGPGRRGKKRSHRDAREGVGRQPTSTPAARSACWSRSTARRTSWRAPTRSRSWSRTSRCRWPPPAPPTWRATTCRATVLEKEREIYRAQMADQKKPPQVIDKIVEGKLEKFFSEQCLLEQPFIKDATGKTQGEGPGGQVNAKTRRTDRRQALRPLPGRRGGLVMAADAGSGRPAYRRIVLKLSGEALAGSQGYGIDPAVLARIASEVREVAELGVQIAIVIGGGNIFRGVAASAGGHGPRHRRLHGHAGDRHQRAGPAGRPREGRPARRACCPPSRCGRWPSPTSAAAPSATSRRAGW